MATFKCSLCPKIYKSPFTFSIHKRLHSNPNRYQCPTCQKNYSASNNLKMHMRIHSLVKNFTCPICSKAFTQLANMQKHAATHTNERPYPCDLCDKTFTRKAHMEQHHLVTHKTTKLHCSHCPRFFNSQEILARHTKICSARIRNFQCKFCDRVLSSAGKLMYHYSVHTGEKPIKCPKCSYTCRRLDLLKHHNQIVHVNGRRRNFGCSECEKKFQTRQSLELHVRFNHRLGKNIKCETCGKLFKTSAELKSHMTSHSNDRHLPCPHCAKMFKTRTSLKCHILTHPQEKENRIKCYFCGKGSCTSGQASSHLLKHIQERGFKCKECEKRFNTYRILRYHFNSVHRPLKLIEERFICSLCPNGDKTYKTLGTLRIHNKFVHFFKSEDLRRCPFCNHGSKTGGDLREHISRIHTLEKPFGCRKCGKGFVSRKELRAHNKNIHVRIY